MTTAKPTPLDPSLCNCLALRQAARSVSQFYDARLAPEGISTGQYSILAILGKKGPLSINELAAAMVMDRTTLGRAVRPLERDGLLGVEPGADARIRRLKLTPAGEARALSAGSRWARAQAEFEAGFGADAATDLRHALHRVVARTRHPPARS